MNGPGIAFRTAHFDDICRYPSNDLWFELLIDNHFGDGGRSVYEAEIIADRFPVTLHSVGLSLGSTDPLDYTYLKKLKQWMERTQAVMVSEHLSWTSNGGVHFHDLLPLPFTEETVTHIVERIKQVQDFLGRNILVENVSSYLTYRQDAMAEWEFIGQVVDQAGCELLLDINNLHVNSRNHRLNAQEYLRHLPLEKISEIHLAGFLDCGDYYLDDHGSPVSDAVWSLYECLIEKTGPLPTCIERDVNIPPFQIILDEAIRSTHVLSRCA